MKKQEQQEEVEQQEVSQPASNESVQQESAVDSEASEDVQEDPIQKLERERSELEAKNKELHNQYLLAMADFDNYRKRMIKEKQEAFDYANANLLSDLLESLDNFDRALDAAASATDVASVVDGVKMIKNQLVSMLENKYNLAGYGEKGDAFDPNIHEAIGSMQAPVAEPVCSEVYLKGYKLKERIIRHAKVMVQMPDGSVSGDGADGTAPTGGAE
ncbi:MAG: nucleotide exchange factor GrpE [Spirochaetaceae bacterium]|nr:nucleotide exchange factor GrpE [Spirochaetaceae bacterium]MBQ4330996.1 nucleotide exchange factor GrpE [Spirochaetaceae bacterium]MBQ7366428.1 nucleotide exchange factor GrpE [Spirochaetaceae bacterium]MBR2363556.1 nucleotide exchange factor GrpE [Spirochaetaceae bacterium]MBR2463030.1 nucleotide exchange factor GrpE [Spirochaetaceae bacterium]